MARTALATTLALAAGALAPAAAHASLELSGPAEVSESAGVATYKVTRSGILGLPPLGAATVTISVTGAPGGPRPAQLTWADQEAGEKTFTVPVDDAVDNDPDRRTATVKITAEGDSAGTDEVQTAIVDDDTTIDVAPGALTIPEGGAGSFTLKPRVAPTRDVRVDLAIVPGTADAADGPAVPPSVTLPAGSTDAVTVPVAAAQDDTDEDDEQFGVSVVPAGMPASAGAVAVTIADDDDTPLVGAVDQRVLEGTGGPTRIAILVGLSRPSSRTVTVAYATREGTAKAPSDFGAAVGRLFFGPGELTKTVSVFLNGDKAPEPDEAFNLVLSDPQNAVVAPTAQTAGLVIVDDDGGSSLGALVTPAGADATPPRVKLGRPARRGTRVRIPITCPRTEKTCRGRITLFSRANARAHRAALRREHRLGAGRFKLAGGRTGRVTIRLSRKARSLVRRAKRLPYRAYAVVRDAADNTATKSVSATLRR